MKIPEQNPKVAHCAGYITVVIPALCHPGWGALGSPLETLRLQRHFSVDSNWASGQRVKHFTEYTTSDLTG